VVVFVVAVVGGFVVLLVVVFVVIWGFGFGMFLGGTVKRVYELVYEQRQRQKREKVDKVEGKKGS